MTNGSQTPTFARRWLIAAGIYNLAWGAIVIFAPNLFFTLIDADLPRYPEIWQCVGMIVGVYGIGYLIAATDSRRHWPIVLVGLLGKIFGPIGFLVALARGTFPPEFAFTLLTNDLIWWIPFTMILWDAAKSAATVETDESPVELNDALTALHDQRGTRFLDLTSQRPTLVVLLRHSGCTFCRETLGELRERAAEIRERGLGIAVVTMSDPESNTKLAGEYGLSDASWISDPNRLAYRALELKRGSFLQLFGPSVWLGGLRAARKGHGIGKLDGDGFQMAGTFVLHDGRVVRAARSKHAASKTDFDAMTCEINLNAESA